MWTRLMLHEHIVSAKLTLGAHVTQVRLKIFASILYVPFYRTLSPYIINFCVGFSLIFVCFWSKHFLQWFVMVHHQKFYITSVYSETTYTKGHILGDNLTKIQQKVIANQVVLSDFNVIFIEMRKRKVIFLVLFCAHLKNWVNINWIQTNPTVKHFQIHNLVSNMKTCI